MKIYSAAVLGQDDHKELIIDTFTVNCTVCDLLFLLTINTTQGTNY